MLDAHSDPWDLPKVSGIYVILNVSNGMSYVGSSNNVRHRCMGHKAKLSNGRHCNRFLQAAWSIGDKFVWFLAEEVADISKIVHRESAHIEKRQSAFGLNGYNLITNPGTGSLAQVVRSKMSASRKLMGSPWNKGRPCSEASKLASKRVHTGRHVSSETRLKLSVALRGPCHPFRGKKSTEQVRAKLSELRRAAPALSGDYKGVYLDRRTKTYCARIYVSGSNLFLGRYPTAVEAAQAYNIAAANSFGPGCFLNKVPAEVPNRNSVLGRPRSQKGAAHV